MPTIQHLKDINSDFNNDVIIQLDEIIHRYIGEKGSLIPVLTGCQEILGYLPVELQGYIGQVLNIPESDVYGVVTFYSYFTMVPKGRHTIRVCMGTACYVRGIGEILNRIQSKYNLKVGETTEDKRFTLEAVRCLGACGLAPVIVVDSNTHGGVTPDKVIDILNGYE